MTILKRLPNEIFIKIFSLLHQEDKVECMLVCQRWKQLISSTCLFQTVCVYSVDGLERLTKKIQQVPEQGIKVERLVIDFITEDDIDLNSLLPLLPNLKDFLLFSPEADQEIDEEVVYPWYKNITHITECAIKTVTYRLLSTTLCPNLKTLSITDNFYDIIPILGNAPALECLDICFGNLNFADLNSIHRNLPHLKSLNMSLITLQGIDFTHDIESATAMKECNFTNVRMHTDDNQTEIKFLKYISMKYPNLSKLEYAYNNRDARKTADDFENIDKLGWRPLFKRLSSQLKNISISGGNEPLDLFKMLDDNKCIIANLKLGSMASLLKISQLVESKQVQYIRSLKFDRIDITDFKWLKHLSQLEKLRLAWRYPDDKMLINLNEIFHNCPKLKIISLQFINIDFDDSDTSVFPLEVMSFRAVKVPPKLDQFIANHFPKLRTLKLKRCEFESKTLDLSPINLISFQINSVIGSEGIGAIITTHQNSTERWYPLDKDRSYLTFYKQKSEYDRTINQEIKSLPVDEGYGTPYLTLICNSLKSFCFKDT